MNKSTTLLSRGLAAASLLTLVACATAPRPVATAAAAGAAGGAARSGDLPGVLAAPLEIRVDEAPGTVSGKPAEQAAPAIRRGSLTFSIRWPQRTTQAIPAEADRLEFVLTDGGVQVAKASIDRPATIVTFDSLPEGTLQLTVRAFKAADTEGTDPLATATETVIIKANQKTSKAITLQPVPKPFEITLLEPQFAFASDRISVYVSNLKTGAQTATMSVGATAVATMDVDVSGTGSGYLAFELPDTVSRGKVLLTASGYTATSSGEVTRIASVSVSPASANGTIDQPVAISVTAKDADGNTLAGATVPYTAKNLSDSTLTPTQIGYFAPGNGYYPKSAGTHQVVFGKAGVVTATVSITVSQ